jgi:hypothetical protein
MACLAAIIFAEGSLSAVPFAIIIALFISLPVTIAATLIVGVPFHALFKRLKVGSLLAHIATGLGASLVIVTLELLDERYGGYENANQAFLYHVVQFVSLMAGPAATTIFWFVARPDLALPGGGPRFETATHDTFLVRVVRRIGATAVAAMILVGVGTIIIGNASKAPRHDEGRSPVKSVDTPFDSAKSAALVTDFMEYGKAHGGRVSYYFMPVSARTGAGDQLLLMIQMTYPDDTMIIATNDGYGHLRAMIYAGSDPNTVDSVWSDFQPFLVKAVADANAMTAESLPRIRSAGEGGRTEPHKWWDWRFR